MLAPSPEVLIAAMRARGYLVFDGARQPDVNLCLLRATPGTLDTFDDLLVEFHREGKAWKLAAYRCTADPGKPSIEHPTRPDGTAVMDEGQHRSAFTFGLHHGTYECLAPCKPILVTRYRSAAEYNEGRGKRSSSSATQVHHASAVHESTVVGPWSEGCAVLANPSDFAALMATCHRQRDAGGGDRFSLSILPWQP